MAREATAPELALLRSPGQFSRFWLAVYKPNTIYTARLDAVPASKDGVASVTYTSGSGTLSDVKAEMTLWVGSTSGARDLGVCRIRKAPISGTFYINMTSEVDWQSSCYLTVVDLFPLSARTPRMDAGTLKLDYETAYSNQHEDFQPVPVLGSHAIAWLTGSTVDVEFDAGDSWVFDSTISSYSWSAPGASATSGTSTATPTFTYNAAGYYRVYCTVTAANGESHTGIRHVFIYDSEAMPHRVELTDSPSGDYEAGGWSFSVKMYADANTTDIVEGALAILFGEDWYGGTKGSIGPVANRENIICAGYIAGESIDWDAETSTVSFSVQGAHEALSQIEINPLKLTLATDTPASWDVITGLTVDRGAWHLLHWRSNVTALMDFYPSGDTRYAPLLETNEGSIWDQLNEMAFGKIFASGGVDRFGRLFLQIDPQCVPEASRTWDTVMTLTERDWRDKININRTTRRRLAMLSTSGWLTDASGGTNVLYALAMGHVQARHGRSEIIDQLLASSQSQFNTLTGMYMGWKNVEYTFDISLAQNNRLIDLFPHQFLDIALATGDTPRGIAYSGNLIPRAVTLQYDPEAGSFSTELECEAETFAELAVNGDIPASTGWDDEGWDDSTFPDFEMPDLSDISDIFTLPPSVENLNHPKVVVINTSQGVFYTTNFDQDSPIWQAMNSGIDPDDLSAISKIVVTPSGAIYILTTNLTLYRAAGIGGTFSLIASYSTLYSGDHYIFGVDINPTASDEIVVIGADVSTGFGYLFKSTGGGAFSRGSYAPLYIYIGSGLVYYTFVYMNNQWVLVFSSPDLYCGIFDSDGDTATGAIIGSVIGQAANSVFAVALPNKVFQWDAYAPAGYNIVTPTATPSAVRYTGFSPSEQWQGVAFSPTGVYGMGASRSPYTPHLSTDGGVTWSSVAGVLSIGSRIWENCKDDNRWIFGGGTTIRLTIDRGASYVEKSGNLGYIAPLVDIKGIRFIS